MAEGGTERGRRAVTLLGLVLATTAAMGLLLLGGAWPGARVALHFGVALALLIGAMLPSRVLAAAGHLPRWTAAVAALVAAVAGGLVPFPQALLRWVAPAMAADWPNAPWRVPSYDPEGTVTALTSLLLVGGFGAAVFAWGAAQGRRWEFQRALLVLAAILVVTAGLHLSLGLYSLFGLVQTSTAEGRLFFAPFVARNHLGATLLLLTPSVLGDAATHRVGRGALPRGVLAVGVLVLLVLTHSPGVAAAGLAMLGLVGFRRWGWPFVAATAPLVLLAAIAAPAWSWMTGYWLEQALDARLRMWRDGLTLVGWSPIFGVGAGAFDGAIERVRTDCVARLWVHAHNVPLEWWLETGITGLVAGAAAAYFARPGPARGDGERARRLTLGLFGLAVHNLIDFSLLLPGVAILAAGMWAARMSVHGERRATRPGATRAILAGFALCQAPAAAWSLTQASADRASAEVNAAFRAPGAATLAAARVGRWAPWRPEGTLAEVWSSDPANEVTVQLARAAAERFPTDGDTQRRLALVFLRTKDCPDALRAAERARQLQPASWRNAEIDARIAGSCKETERMVAAWTRALTCQAPQRAMAEAYRDFPVAIVWVDRLADQPARLRRLAAIADRDGDSASAALAWDLAARAPAYANTLEQVEVLVRAGRLDDARERFAAARAAHPEHPRLLAVAAKLSGDGAAVPDVPTGAVARKIRAAEAEGGPASGMAELERQVLLGNGLDPSLQYERARLKLALNDAPACAALLTAARLAEHPILGESSRVLLQRCEQAAP